MIIRDSQSQFSHYVQCRLLVFLHELFIQVNKITAMMDRIRALGPGASVDVDQMALRITLDVIGLVGGWVSMADEHNPFVRWMEVYCLSIPSLDLNSDLPCLCVHLYQQKAHL